MTFLYCLQDLHEMFYDMALLVEEQVRAQSHSQALIPIPEPGNETGERGTLQ